ncbi:MAG: NOB1 family endonuclease [Candidatus Thorarchaeota archaeon]
MTRFVLDVAALLFQWTRQNPDAVFLTTPAVLDEIRNRPSRERAESLISTGRLRVEVPEPDHIKDATKAADATGDSSVLSATDIELIALTLQESRLDLNVAVVSTDLALLNTAASLGLDTIDPDRRMRHVIRWRIRCPACGHQEENDKTILECPVCGTQMRRKAGHKREVT